MIKEMCDWLPNCPLSFTMNEWKKKMLKEIKQGRRKRIGHVPFNPTPGTPSCNATVPIYDFWISNTNQILHTILGSVAVLSTNTSLTRCSSHTLSD